MKRIYILIPLLLIALLVGCSKDKEGQNSGGNEGKQKDAPFETSFPLTGIPTNEKIDHRPVGVMVNNHPKARPQSGLSQADIVFEILAEGDITRFLALYHSEQPEVVGPVRSAREYYFDLAVGYDALYVYHGAANFVNDMIRGKGVEHLDGAKYDNDRNLFKRESFRKAPHNSYVQFGAIDDVAETKGYEMEKEIEPLLFLSDDETVSGDPAESVTVKYPGRGESNVINYLYDQKNEKYTRFDANEQTVELDTENPIEIDNLFIVEAHHEVFDSAGRRIVDLTDSGTAYLIQKGKVQQLDWRNVDGRIIPEKDGQPVGFVAGKTWVNVVPANPGIESSVKISKE